MYSKISLNGDVPSGYRLCYVEPIPMVIQDWTPESKKILAESGLAAEDYMKLPDARYICMTEYPNPNYKEGEQEFLAYFTPVDMRFQDGDEWDTVEYEYNSGIPYDSINGTEHDIVIVPFAVRSYSCMLPKDWVITNNPFSIRDINGGAVAWVYSRCESGSVAIYGGESIESFAEKLDRIATLNPEFYLG